MSLLKSKKLSKHKFYVISKGRKFLTYEGDLRSRSIKRRARMNRSRRLRDAIKGSRRGSRASKGKGMIRSEVTSMNSVFMSDTTKSIREQMSALVSDQIRIMESGKKKEY